MKSFCALAVAVWCLPLMSVSLADEPPAWRKLEIETAIFTEDKVGVFHLELEKVANYLGLYTYKTLAAEIKAGNAESRLRARRYLSLAFQMDPQNIIAKRINEMLANGSTEELETPLPQEPEEFVQGTVRLIKRLQERTEPDALRLAGFLALVAADLDPKNEDAVYVAEIFARKLGDVSPAWKELALGKSPASPTSPPTQKPGQ